MNTNTEKIVKYLKDWYPSRIKQKPVFGNVNKSTIIKEKILKELE